MDKQPVGTLPDLTASSLDDEIMIITDSEHNQLKKEKISDLITDFTSTNENNALTKGTDGKMFVTDFGNASNITEGTLPTSVLPEIPLEKIPDIPKSKLPDIETSDLPVSGVSADTYAYPSSVTVNAQGQVTAIEEGTPSASNANVDLSNLTDEGEKHFLNKTQITNCILSAPNGVATYSGNSLTLKSGLKILCCDGLNSDGTLKNSEVILDNDVTRNFSGLPTGLRYIGYNKTTNEILYYNTYYVSNTQPNIDTSKSEIWYNPQENFTYVHDTNEDIWTKVTNRCVLGTMFSSSTGTEFNMYQPVELLKRSDKAEIAGWGFPSDRFDDLTLGASGSTYTAPANGWFWIQKLSSSTRQFLTPIIKDSNGNIKYTLTSQPTAAGYDAEILAPVSKGDVININYSLDGATKSFRFVYAEGSN